MWIKVCFVTTVALQHRMVLGMIAGRPSRNLDFRPPFAVDQTTVARLEFQGKPVYVQMVGGAIGGRRFPEFAALSVARSPVEVFGEVS